MHTNHRQIYRHNKKVLNTALKMMLVISSLYLFSFAMFSPIYALFVEKINGDITTAANAYAVSLLVAGVTTFLTGRIENKMKETELAIMWSQFVAGLAYILHYFTEAPAMLYAAQGMLGLAAAIFWPAFHSVYGKHVDKENAAWQWSFYDALAYLIPAGAAVLGGWLVKVYSFDVVFLAMAGLSFVCGLFILFLPRKLL